MKKKLSILLFTALSTTAYSGGGYRISLQGNRQLGMGHTGTGIFGQHVESIFFNPASGIYLSNKWSFAGGAMRLNSKVNFQNTMYNWSNSTENVGTPFYAYANYKVNDKVAIGLAAYTPYGSSVNWEQDWEGSHLVNSIDLKALYIQPTVSVKVLDNVSVGLGVIYVNGGVSFNKNLSRTLTDENGNRSDIDLNASDVHSWGYTVGIAAQLTDAIDLGVSYRSKIDMNVTDGDARFNQLPSYAAATYQNGKFSATMPLPAELSIGSSYKFSKNWLVALDYNYNFWNAYKNLTINFNDPNIPTSINARNYKNSSTFRAGLQYQASNKFTARIGGYYNESPVKEGYFAPETPRNNGLAATCGFTYQVTPRLGIDFSVMSAYFKEIDASYDHYYEDGTPISFEGTYRSSAYSIGLGVSYNL